MTVRLEVTDPVDIYTLRTIVTPTEEHILPRCLGGRISKIGLIDKRTNDEFGGGIDARLDEGLRSIRVIVNAKSADGKPPRALRSVEGADGKKYTVAPGGEMIPEPRIVTTKLPTGETQIQGTVSDTGVLKNMLRNYARRSEKNLDDLVEEFAASAKTRIEAPPALTFGFELWDEGPYRATAKIACNLLALTVPGLFHDGAFTEIRQYVLKGARAKVHPVQTVEAELPNGIGAIDHLVRVDVQSSGEVSALVVYFGHLAFVVRLGTVSPRDPVRIAYRVDQLTGTDRVDDLVDLAIAIPPFDEAASMSYEEFVRMAVAQLEKLIPVAQKIQRDLWLERILADLFQRFFAEVGDGEQTESQRRALYDAIIMRIAEELAPQIARESQRQREAAYGRLSAEKPKAPLPET